MRKYFFLLIIVFGLVGCNSPELERPDVTISWGMRLNESQDAGQINPNLSKLRELVMRDLVLELPLKADSLGMPQVVLDVPKEMTGLLSTYRNRLQLAFCNTNEAELFPQGKHADPARWFARLQSEIERNLGLLALTMPERVIVGGELGPMAEQDAGWKAMFEALRSKYPKTHFSVGEHIDLLENSGLGAISDELTVDYAPLAGEQVKAESRAENQRIAALAQRLGKPVFIYRANLMGEGQLLQLKNRLRFWPEELQLTGLCINTLYAPIAARDDHTYYGLADNADVLEYLEAYRRATFDHARE